jgi:glycolate oxidase subunit GlcD
MRSEATRRAASRTGAVRLAPLAASLDGEVLTDPEALTAYAGDASPATPVIPEAVVLARSIPDISKTLRWATDHGVPVTPRGAGTGKAGGCIATPGGIVLSLAPMTRILSVRADDGWAEVEPGVITGPFRDEMAAQGLFYPPDPNSLATCTLGGNVATNAGGPVAVKYGVTSRFVMGVTAVLADGRVIETGRRQPKSVAGYDLTSLLVGSEGTLAVIAGIRLALLPQPREIVTALMPFESVRDAAATVSSARRLGITPRAIELVDGVVLQRIRPHAPFPIDPSWGALLLVEFDGAPGRAAADLDRFIDSLPPPGPIEVRHANDPAEREALWATRRFMSKLVKKGAVGWFSEDIAVPLSTLPELVDRLAEIADRHRLVVATYGHAGDGNLHVNVLWDEPTGAERAEAAVEDVFRAALDLGGTISGEHGIGTLKRKYLPWEQAPPVIELQQALKRQWDPAGILNPGKLL